MDYSRLGQMPSLDEWFSGVLAELRLNRLLPSRMPVDELREVINSAKENHHLLALLH